jgi:hypothetical protein
VTILAFVLAIDAALHGLLVYRFGVKENMSFFVYVFIYAILALAVFFAVPHVLWPTLILSLIGIVGLTVRFNQPKRDKTIDKAIWMADAAAVGCTLYQIGPLS